MSAGGDIWSSGAFVFESSLKDLLDTRNFCLEDLLNEDELLQELKGCHPDLTSYFSDVNHVAGLLKWLLMPPPTAASSISIISSSNPSESNNNNDDNNNNNITSNTDIDTDTDTDINTDTTAKSQPETEKQKETIVNGTNNNTDVNINTDVDVNVDDGTHEPKAPGAWMMEHITEEIPNPSTTNTNPPTTTAATTTPLSQEEYDKYYIRYPYMACEVICCETESIIDILVEGTVSISYASFLKHGPVGTGGSSMDDVNGNVHDRNGNASKHMDDDDDDDDDDMDEEQESLLDILFSVLFNTPATSTVNHKIDDRRAGYLEKILSMLFKRRPKIMTSYLNGDHLISTTTTSTTTTKNTSDDNVITNPTNQGMNHTNNHEIDNVNIDVDEYNIPIHKGGGIPLLEAMFHHLYSNSISQILQHLLMPSQKQSSSSSSKSNHDDHNQNNQNHNNHEWNSNANQDEEEEDYDDGNLITSGIDEEYGNIECNWADSEYALHLLLGRLLGKSARNDELDDLLNDDDDHNGDDDDDDDDEKEQTRFDTSQHAAEILITIIQHSTLSSNIMKILTKDDMLSRLIESACYRSKTATTTTTATNEKNNSTTKKKRKSLDYFSMHESTMTTAMSVLEILVLQLGGYGTVPVNGGESTYNDESINHSVVQENYNSITSSSALSNNKNVEISFTNQQQQDTTNHDYENDHQNDEQQNQMIQASTEIFEQEPSPLPPSKPSNKDCTTEADETFLLQQLPVLLTRLSELLRHPNAQNWTSSVQYSDQPQPLLGASRLRIVRLIESLVLLGKEDVDHILCKSNCLEICLDLFWDFPWCSMLHQSVANLLVHVLEGGEERGELQRYFLYDCNLITRLMSSFHGVPANSNSMHNNNEVMKMKETRSDDVVNSTVSELNSLNHKNELETIIDIKKCASEPVCSDPSLDVDVERGSSTSSEGDDNDGMENMNEADADVIPVSDDDVDAAMEQEEEQMNHAATKGGDDNDFKNDDGGPTNPNKEGDEGEDTTSSVGNKMNGFIGLTTGNTKPFNFPFRIGYMGHVIIICQALVHACGTNEENDEVSPDAIISLPTEGNRDHSNKSTGTDLSNHQANPNTADDVENQLSGDLSSPSSLSDVQNVATPNAILDDGIISTTEDGTIAATEDIATKALEYSSILGLLREHSMYSEWLGFVTSTLASETAVQSTPLGGCNNQNESNITERDDETNWANNELGVNNDDGPVSRGTYTGENGVIDPDNTRFDDTEVDIANELMTNYNLSVPSTNGIDESESNSNTNSRHRRHGVLGGEGSGNGSVNEFGTVVHLNPNPGDYVYENPLAWPNPFPDEYDDNFDESPDSNESDGNDAENDAPVLNLFAGNMNFNDSSAQNNDTAWANFDEAFAQCTVNGDTQIIDSSPDPFSETNSPMPDDHDLFGRDSNSPLFQDNTTIVSSQRLSSDLEVSETKQ